MMEAASASETLVNYQTTRHYKPEDSHRLDDGSSKTSETSVNFYQTTRCYNPEDSNLDFELVHLRPILAT
jgi:hypothetical protein